MSMYPRRGPRLCIFVHSTSVEWLWLLSMPLLRGDPGAAAAQDRTPLYVSTDEADPVQLAVLREAGCKIAADYGGDAMAPAMLFMAGGVLRTCT
jgi:hypothetical protein